MNLFPGSQFNTQMLDSPVAQDFVSPMPATSQETNTPTMQPPDRFQRPSLSNTPDPKSGPPSFLSRTGSHDHNSMRSNSRPESEKRSSTSVPTRMSLASLQNQQPVAQDPAQDLPKDVLNNQLQEFNKASWQVPSGGFPSTMHQNPHMKTQFKNAYSSTGFDMLGVLVGPKTDYGIHTHTQANKIRCE
jgi:hypothetical protein